MNTAGGGEARQIIITAAKDDGDEVQRVRKFFATRIAAALMPRHDKRQQAAFEARNNHFFDSPVYIAGQDHHCFAKRHLQYERSNAIAIFIAISSQ